MLAEAKQHYRGVLCRYCHQGIPISPSAELKERVLKEQGPDGLDDFALRSGTLRCRACHGESVYTQAAVIDLDGAPRKRGRQTRKSPPKS